MTSCNYGTLLCVTTRRGKTIPNIFVTSSRAGLEFINMIKFLWHNALSPWETKLVCYYDMLIYVWKQFLLLMNYCAYFHFKKHDDSCTKDKLLVIKILKHCNTVYWMLCSTYTFNRHYRYVNGDLHPHPLTICVVYHNINEPHKNLLQRLTYCNLKYYNNTSAIQFAFMYWE